MAKFLYKHRRGTTSEWDSKGDLIKPLEGEIVIEIDTENNLHKLKIGDGVHTYSELKYLMAGDEIVTQVLAEVAPRVVTVELTLEWNLDANGKYSQVIALDGITNRSRLDLQPAADMVAEFKQLGLVFVTENNAGVITVYSVGNRPLKPYVMQATIIETKCDSQDTPIIGIPIGIPMTVVQTTGNSEDDVMSQKATTDAIKTLKIQQADWISALEAGIDHLRNVYDYEYEEGDDITNLLPNAVSRLSIAKMVEWWTKKYGVTEEEVGDIEAKIPTVVQEEGTSETAVMSQKATTEAIKEVADNIPSSGISPIYYYDSLDAAIKDINGQTLSGSRYNDENQICSVYKDFKTANYVITLLKDIELIDGSYTISQNSELNLNGHKITDTIYNNMIYQLFRADTNTSLAIIGEISGSEIEIQLKVSSDYTSFSGCVRARLGSSALVVKGGTYKLSAEPGPRTSTITMFWSEANRCNIQDTNIEVDCTTIAAESCLGIKAVNGSETELKNNTIEVVSGHKTTTYGYNIGTTDVVICENNKVFADAPDNAVNTNAGWSYGGLVDVLVKVAYLTNEKLVGTHSGLYMCASKSYINGGTYESCAHGGIYYAGSNSINYITNAIVGYQNYEGKFDSSNFTNKGGFGSFYIGGSSGRHDIRVYMDNCILTADQSTETAGQDDGVKPYGPVLRGTDGESNCVLYISNTNLPDGKKLRVDPKHKAFVGKNTNITTDKITTTSAFEKPGTVTFTDFIYREETLYTNDKFNEAKTYTNSSLGSRPTYGEMWDAIERDASVYAEGLVQKKLQEIVTSKNLFQFASYKEELKYVGEDGDFYESGNFEWDENYTSYLVMLPAGEYCCNHISSAYYEWSSDQLPTGDNIVFTIEEDDTGIIFNSYQGETNKLYSTEYTADEVEDLGKSTLSENVKGKIITTDQLLATDYIGTNELYIGEDDDVVLDVKGLHFGADNNPNQGIYIGDNNAVVINQQGMRLSKGAKLFVEGNDVIGDIKTDLDTKADKNQVSNAVSHTFTNKVGKLERIDGVSPIPQNFNITLKGNSTQESEPALDAPVEVISISNPTLSIYSKNLIPYPYQGGDRTVHGVTITQNEDGSLTLNGQVDTDVSTAYAYYNHDNVPVFTLKKGTTYRLSCDSRYMSLRLYTKDNWTPIMATYTNAKEKILTPDEDIQIYRILGYFFDNYKEAVIKDHIIFPMLEILGENKDYEPYKLQSVTVPLTLAGQGDYKDEIVVDQNTKTVKHIQKYYKYQFTGNETWNVQTSMQYDNTKLGIINPSAPATFDEVRNQISNAIPAMHVYSKDATGIYGSSHMRMSQLQIFARIPHDKNFNDVLNSETYLWYPLRWPIETDYTNTEWGQQLLNLTSCGKALTIVCDAELTVDYNKDVNCALEEIIYGPNYELLYEETLQEDVLEKYIRLEEDKQPYGLKAFYLYIKFPVTEAARTLDGHVNFTNEARTSAIGLVNCYTNNVTSNTVEKHFYISGKFENGSWYDVWKSSQADPSGRPGAGNGKDASVTKVFSNHTNMITMVGCNYLSEIKIKFTSSNMLNIGTVIKLYGVKEEKIV